MGARVIATSSSDEKLEQVQAIGATDLINYRITPDWASEILKLTDGKGVDLVADVVGAETIEHSLRAVRQGGTVCVVGHMGTPKPVQVVLPLMIGIKTCKLENPSNSPRTTY